jgi:P27 family predicted phage terminase small subunit
VKTAEPTPRKGTPTAPPHLTVRARARWQHLTTELDAMKILTTADGGIIALAADAWSDYLDAREAVQKAGGATYKSKTAFGATLIKTHPAALAMREAWRRVRLAEIELGLTPAARSRVQIQPPEPDDPLEDHLTKGPRRL